jgi:Tol biopolymer transport system component
MTHSALKPLLRRRPKLFALVACLGTLVVVLIPQSSSKSLVRKQVALIESQNNWSLVAVRGDKIQEVQFADRYLKEIGSLPKSLISSSSISTDGKWIAFDVCADDGQKQPTGLQQLCPSGFPHLAVLATDSMSLRENPSLVYPSAMCWSPDNSKLVLNASDHLDLLDVRTGSTKVIDGTDAFASEQCWSPDAQHVVYMVNQDKGIRTLRIYNLAENKSLDVASGGNASWSPDGERIAFLYCPPSLDDCAYKVVLAGGGQETLLFKIDRGTAPLLWSPDSRFVAYVSFRTFWEHTFLEKLDLLVPVERLDVDNRLRIRRLDDNSEDWLLNLGNTDPRSFKWVRRISSAN